MMERKELEVFLINKNIRPDTYSLNGGLPNEAYCLDEKNGIWKTYYSERGSAVSVKEFDSENDACEYFLNWLIDDPAI
jgi:hypothetical protein